MYAGIYLTKARDKKKKENPSEFPLLMMCMWIILDRKKWDKNPRI